MKRASSIAVLAAALTLGLTAQIVGACDFRSVLSGDIFARRSENRLPSATRTTHAHTPDAARDYAPGATQAGESSSMNFRWRGQLAAGRVVEIKGVLGSIKAEPASGNEVEVVAEKSAKRSNPEDVRVQVVEHAEGVTVCAVYPSGQAGKVNTCEPGDAHRMNVRDNDVQVEFTVRVPAGIRFDARTVNGSIEARGLSADVDAHTVNGSIRLATSGLARAKTVNGSINASLGRANWTDELEFATVNGRIELSFPGDLNTELHAETVNGDITSDFPVTVQGRYSKRTVNGVIGNGGRGLRLKTVNGDMQIRRAS